MLRKKKQKRQLSYELYCDGCDLYQRFSNLWGFLDYTHYTEDKQDASSSEKNHLTLRQTLNLSIYSLLFLICMHHRIIHTAVLSSLSVRSPCLYLLLYLHLTLFFLSFIFFFSFLFFSFFAQLLFSAVCSTVAWK